MNEWISLKDRLPEESIRGDNPYQVASNDGSIFQAFYVEGEFAFGEYELSGITHWMELFPPEET